MKKVGKVFIILMITLLIVALGIEGYFLIQNKKDSDKKISNLENQLSLIESVNKNNVSKSSETENNTMEKQTEVNDVSNADNSKEKIDKYIGKWTNQNGEIEILGINNNFLSFSWAIYRTAILDNTVIPIKNNTAIFYFQGYDDKNFNLKQDDGEHYYRKATIKLEDNSIIVNVEEIDSSKFDVSLEKDFAGQVYITESTQIYNK